MKNVTIFSMLGLLLLSFGCNQNTDSVYIETESFDNKGGWVIDQQSMNVLGSPYIMAHGMGTPVVDASTIIEIPKTGEYQVYVRTRNWTALWSDVAAGKFEVMIDGQTLGTEFGTQSNDWSWEDGGIVDLREKQIEIVLHDLTGFNGRCDAIYLSPVGGEAPVNSTEGLSQLRKKCHGPEKDPVASSYDMVIVGGGMPGTCAAISAARLGVKVALIQDRPVLGGNNSSEVRVHLGARINLDPYPALGNLVNEIGPARGGNAEPKDYYEDDKKLQAVQNEPNISLFLNYHANEVIMKGSSIEKVIAQNLETGEKISLSASLFADCTGDGTIGYLAGAEYMIGRESRATFNEETAPEEADNMTMGISVQWYSEAKKEAVSFPDISWGLPWNDEKAFAIRRGDWDWETGMGKDMINETEYIRDYGLLVVYSNWSYLKNHYSDKAAFENEEMQWVAYIGGKRESRRLIGDFILTQNEITEQNILPDGTAPSSWSIDLHYPDPENIEKFDGDPFRSIAKHIQIYPYPIPYRCLYSKNIDNLMMGGRNISVSHVALGTVRLMRTGGMMGEVIGMAASVCTNHQVLPRDVYPEHFSELVDLMEVGVGNPTLPFTQDYNKGGSLLNKKKNKKH